MATVDGTVAEGFASPRRVLVESLAELSPFSETHIVKKTLVALRNVKINVPDHVLLELLNVVLENHLTAVENVEQVMVAAAGKRAGKRAQFPLGFSIRDHHHHGKEAAPLSFQKAVEILAARPPDKALPSPVPQGPLGVNNGAVSQAPGQHEQDLDGCSLENLDVRECSDLPLTLKEEAVQTLGADDPTDSSTIAKGHGGHGTLGDGQIKLLSDSSSNERDAKQPLAVRLDSAPIKELSVIHKSNLMQDQPGHGLGVLDVLSREFITQDLPASMELLTSPLMDSGSSVGAAKSLVAPALCVPEEGVSEGCSLEGNTWATTSTAHLPIGSEGPSQHEVNGAITHRAKGTLTSTETIDLSHGYDGDGCQRGRLEDLKPSRAVTTSVPDLTPHAYHASSFDCTNKPLLPFVCKDKGIPCHLGTNQDPPPVLCSLEKVLEHGEARGTQTGPSRESPLQCTSGRRVVSPDRGGPAAAGATGTSCKAEECILVHGPAAEENMRACIGELNVRPMPPHTCNIQSSCTSGLDGGNKMLRPSGEEGNLAMSFGQDGFLWARPSTTCGSLPTVPEPVMVLQPLDESDESGLWSTALVTHVEVGMSACKEVAAAFTSLAKDQRSVGYERGILMMGDPYVPLGQTSHYCPVTLQDDHGGIMVKEGHNPFADSLRGLSTPYVSPCHEANEVCLKGTSTVLLDASDLVGSPPSGAKSLRTIPAGKAASTIEERSGGAWHEALQAVACQTDLDLLPPPHGHQDACVHQGMFQKMFNQLWQPHGEPGTHHPTDGDPLSGKPFSGTKSSRGQLSEMDGSAGIFYSAFAMPPGLVQYPEGLWSPHVSSPTALEAHAQYASKCNQRGQGQHDVTPLGACQSVKVEPGCEADDRVGPMDPHPVHDFMGSEGPAQLCGCPGGLPVRESCYTCGCQFFTNCNQSTICCHPLETAVQAPDLANHQVSSDGPAQASTGPQRSMDLSRTQDPPAPEPAFPHNLAAGSSGRPTAAPLVCHVVDPLIGGVIQTALEGDKALPVPVAEPLFEKGRALENNKTGEGDLLHIDSVLRPKQDVVQRKRRKNRAMTTAKKLKSTTAPSLSTAPGQQSHRALPGRTIAYGEDPLLMARPRSPVKRAVEATLALRRKGLQGTCVYREEPFREMPGEAGRAGRSNVQEENQIKMTKQGLLNLFCMQQDGDDGAQSHMGMLRAPLELPDWKNQLKQGLVSLFCDLPLPEVNRKGDGHDGPTSQIRPPGSSTRKPTSVKHARKKARQLLRQDPCLELQSLSLPLADAPNAACMEALHAPVCRRMTKGHCTVLPPKSSTITRAESLRAGPEIPAATCSGHSSSGLAMSFRACDVLPSMTPKSTLKTRNVMTPQPDTVPECQRPPRAGTMDRYPSSCSQGAPHEGDVSSVNASKQKTQDHCWCFSHDEEGLHCSGSMSQTPWIALKEAAQNSASVQDSPEVSLSLLSKDWLLSSSDDEELADALRRIPRLKERIMRKKTLMPSIEMTGYKEPTKAHVKCHGLAKSFDQQAGGGPDVPHGEASQQSTGIPAPCKAESRSRQPLEVLQKKVQHPFDEKSHHLSNGTQGARQLPTTQAKGNDADGLLTSTDCGESAALTAGLRDEPPVSGGNVLFPGRSAPAVPPDKAAEKSREVMSTFEALASSLMSYLSSLTSSPDDSSYISSMKDVEGLTAPLLPDIMVEERKMKGKQLDPPQSEAYKACWTDKALGFEDDEDDRLWAMLCRPRDNDISNGLRSGKAEVCEGSASKRKEGMQEWRRSSCDSWDATPCIPDASGGHQDMSPNSDLDPLTACWQGPEPVWSSVPTGGSHGPLTDSPLASGLGDVDFTVSSDEEHWEDVMKRVKHQHLRRGLLATNVSPMEDPLHAWSVLDLQNTHTNQVRGNLEQAPGACDDTNGKPDADGQVLPGGSPPSSDRRSLCEEVGGAPRLSQDSARATHMVLPDSFKGNEADTSLQLSPPEHHQSNTEQPAHCGRPLASMYQESKTYELDKVWFGSSGEPLLAQGQRDPEGLSLEAMKVGDPQPSLRRYDKEADPSSGGGPALTGAEQINGEASLSLWVEDEDSGASAVSERPKPKMHPQGHHFQSVGFNTSTDNGEVGQVASDDDNTVRMKSKGIPQEHNWDGPRIPGQRGVTRSMSDPLQKIPLARCPKIPSGSVCEPTMAADIVPQHQQGTHLALETQNAEMHWTPDKQGGRYTTALPRLGCRGAKCRRPLAETGFEAESGSRVPPLDGIQNLFAEVMYT